MPTTRMPTAVTARPTFSPSAHGDGLGALFRRLKEHLAHHVQIVEGGDDAGEDAHDGQGHGLRRVELDGRAKDKELAQKAPRARDAGQRKQRHEQDTGHDGRALDEATIVGNLGGTGGALKGNDRRKDGQVGEEVGKEVEQRTVDAQEGALRRPGSGR